MTNGLLFEESPSRSRASRRDMVIYKKKEKNVDANDSKEYGDIYSLTAIKPDTRLFLSHCEGKRTAEDCIRLFSDIEKRRAIDSPIPVFTSDNWDPFEEGLLNGSRTQVTEKHHENRI
ncbi:MAG TPA: hypothetical protein DCX03_09890 [Bacteroidales bacterium]|jgi:hypothetical protein|nr:hypothetical protein [Bacteroidales bacterium]